MAKAASILRRLGTPRGAALESSGGSDPLADAQIREALKMSRATLLGAGGLAPRDTVERLLADAEQGFAKLAQEGTEAGLSRAEYVALEAVIETGGARPAVFVQDGTIPVDVPELAQWGAAAAFRSPIERVIASVGRVDAPDIDPGKAGTAFMFAPGIVITNRHVLEGVAAWDGARWRYRNPTTVDFAGEYQRSATNRFTLGEVLFCGPDPINWAIDFRHLDVAVIRLEAGAQDFPTPLSFERDPGYYTDTGRGRRHVQVIGFPGEPWLAPGDGGNGAPPPAQHEYAQVIDGLFRNTFGVKRWAPGEIHAAPGELEKDKTGWVFSHDASTLAGSSGSCIVDLRDNGERVIGIHFGGLSRQVNWGHAFAALKAFLPGSLGTVWPVRRQ